MQGYSLSWSNCIVKPHPPNDMAALLLLSYHDERSFSTDLIHLPVAQGLFCLYTKNLCWLHQFPMTIKQQVVNKTE
jgi:hypothetical protein